MDNWSEQFWQSLIETARETGRWCQQVADDWTSTTDEWIQAADTWSYDLQQRLEPEIEQAVDEWQQLLEPWEGALAAQIATVSEQLEQALDPLVISLVASLDQWVEELSGPINSTLDPLLQDQPACVGCRHYYGQTHGGHLLVCAMYPFGCDTERCPDWTPYWPDSSDSSG